MPILSPELGNQVSVCIITILQSVRVSSKATGIEVTLHVKMSTTKIALMGAAKTQAGHCIEFRLLVADNNGYEQSLVIAQPIESLLAADHIVEAQARNGIFTVEQRSGMA